MLMGLRSLSITLALALTVAGAISAAEPSADDVKTAEYLRTGWRSEREKLLTGRCQIEGTLNRRPINVTFCFDHPKSLRKYHIAWQDRYDGSWLVTPELLAQCAHNAAPVVQLLKPTDPALSFVRELDPRCFGVSLVSDLYHGVALSTLAKRLEGMQLQEVNRTGDGLFQIVGIRPGNNKLVAKHIVTINELKGFSPERYEVIVQTDGHGPWTRATSSAVEWEQQNGVWVPVRLIADGVSNDHSEFRITWEGINAAIGPDEFDIQNLGAPVGTLIADSRLSKDDSIILGKVGQGNALNIPGVTIQSTNLLTRTSVIIVLMNVALVSILCFIILRRRRTKLRQAGL
jgi:hypothetical protein